MIPKTYPPFKQSDGNGGSMWSWSKILEKLISSIIIIIFTGMFTSYIVLIRLENRIDRVESCVKKMGKVFWQHTNPGTSYPFDEFERIKNDNSFNNIRTVEYNRCNFNE